MIENPPVVQETRVRSLGQENALEKEMAIHSSILAQKSPDTPGSPEGNTEGPGTASSEPLLPS